MKCSKRCWHADVIPVIPSQGSVGASGDLAPLAHLTAAMLGIGEVQLAGERMPAADALARAGLAPLALGPKEGLALLNGTQFSTAEALAGLFAIERVFQAALVTGALSTDAAKGSDTPFDARIHALRGHRGQIEVAAALRALMAGSAIRASHLVNDDRVQDPVLPALPAAGDGRGARSGAAGRGDVGDRSEWRLRQSADLRGQRRGAVRRQFPRRAGGVRRRHSGDRGVRDRLARRAAHRHADRSRALGAAGVSHAAAGAQFRLHGRAGDGGGAGRREQAARLSGERRFRSRPPPTRRITSRWRRTARAGLSAMAENAANVVAIELLAAAQGCDFHAPMRSSAPLERVRARLRDEVPRLDTTAISRPTSRPPPSLVRSGALAKAAGALSLPEDER